MGNKWVDGDRVHWGGEGIGEEKRGEVWWGCIRVAEQDHCCKGDRPGGAKLERRIRVTLGLVRCVKLVGMLSSGDACETIEQDESAV